MASGRDGLGSGWRAIQVSSAAISSGNTRTPIRSPVPVVVGRSRFFALSLIEFTLEVPLGKRGRHWMRHRYSTPRALKLPSLAGAYARQPETALRAARAAFWLAFSDARSPAL